MLSKLILIAGLLNKRRAGSSSVRQTNKMFSVLHNENSRANIVISYHEVIYGPG